ncbi:MULTISPECIES: I78 family peptidase inhibitor [unclassified Novosphingobium]|uniref:I78 family peptidase inhibitor n=1 Tax=unclassified Novosphingobium TaxID=2644732 RepID=UPI00135BB807|nr:MULTISPECIES: I78 family peptidase inhibitor [unclassified Novosphingobium]
MSRTKIFALPAVVAAALGACSAQTPPPEASAPPATEMEPGCGADQLAGYVGRKASDDVIASITAWRGDKPIRVLKPDSAMTMDYRPDRLNIAVDAKGIITGLSCT